MFGFLKRLLGGARSEGSESSTPPQRSRFGDELDAEAILPPQQTRPTPPRNSLFGAPPRPSAASIARRIPLRPVDPRKRPIRLKPQGDPILKDWICTEMNVAVVGTSYRKSGVVQVIARAAQRDDVEIVLRREPRNEHDRNAIAVDILGLHAGYIPADVASIWAPRMDADPASVSFALDLLWLTQDEHVKIVLDLLQPQALVLKQAEPPAEPKIPEPPLKPSLDFSVFADLVLLAGAARSDGRMAAVEKAVFMRYAETRVPDLGMVFDAAEADKQLKKLKKLDDADILEKLAAVARMQPERKRSFMQALEVVLLADGKEAEAETRFLSLAQAAIRLDDAPPPPADEPPPTA